MGLKEKLKEKLHNGEKIKTVGSKVKEKVSREFQRQKVLHEQKRYDKKMLKRQKKALEAEVKEEEKKEYMATLGKETYKYRLARAKAEAKAEAKRKKGMSRIQWAWQKSTLVDPARKYGEKFDNFAENLGLTGKSRAPDLSSLFGDSYLGSNKVTKGKKKTEPYLSSYFVAERGKKKKTSKDFGITL